MIRSSTLTVVALLVSSYVVVSGSSARMSGGSNHLSVRTCYKDDEFVEALIERAPIPAPLSVCDRMAEIHYHVKFISEDMAFCSQIAEIMLSLKREFIAIYHRVESSGRMRLIGTPDVPTHEQFWTKLLGYTVALSGHPRGPASTSRKGVGKLKTMAVVDYAVMGDEKNMMARLTPAERSLIDTVLAFYGSLLKDESSSLHQYHARVSPPPTPSFDTKGTRSMPSSSGVPEFLPGHDGWYELVFGVVSNLLTWENEELVRLYKSVLLLLMSEDAPISPNSRSSIYRSLMYINRQLFLDRCVGIAPNDVVSTIVRIGTYKRILSRLVNVDNPFVFSFEQLEMIDLYEGFTNSAEYESSRDFAYKDSLERGLLLYGILFSLEFDEPSNLISNVVVSAFKRIVDSFPIENEGLHTLLSGMVGKIRELRENPRPDVESAETHLLAVYGTGSWITPVDLGAKYLNIDYCERFREGEAKNNCEQMIPLIERQMIGNHEWMDASMIVALEQQQVILPLLRLDKIILNRVVQAADGTEAFITALEAILAGIQHKLVNQRPIDLTDEKRLIERLLESTESVTTESPSTWRSAKSRRDERKAKRAASRKGGR